MCTQKNGLDAVIGYEYDDSDSCGGYESHQSTALWAGTVYGGCDQSSRTLYRVDNCMTATTNAGLDICSFFQRSATSNRYPWNSCRQGSNCLSGNSCQTRYIEDASDASNITVLEEYWSNTMCSGNSTGIIRTDDAVNSLYAYRLGATSCFVHVTEYGWSNQEYLFCNYAQEKGRGDRFDPPSTKQIMTNPSYIYVGNDNAGISYGAGLITGVNPAIPGACYSSKEGYRNDSWSYVCNSATDTVDVHAYFGNRKCEGTSRVIETVDYDDVTQNCDDSTAEAPKGTYDTELHFSNTYNPDATQFAGHLGCKACYHYYADWNDRPYYERELMVVRSSVQANHWMMEHYYFNSTCYKPFATNFDLLRQNTAGDYPRYDIKDCDNDQAKLPKGYIKEIYGSSWYEYPYVNSSNNISINTLLTLVTLAMAAFFAY